MKNLYFIVAMVSFSIFQGCASMEYRKAIEDSQNHWGICSGTNDFGPLNDIKIFKLSRVVENGIKEYWLEGHSNFYDDDETGWSISILTKKEMKSSKPSGSCVTKSLFISSLFHFSQETGILYKCENDLKIAPFIRSSLKTSKDKWFMLEIYCRKTSGM